MASEEEALRAFRDKYGDAAPKPRLIARDVKHFDSADWAMRKSLDGARASAEAAKGEGARGGDARDASGAESEASARADAQGAGRGV